jgi:hypothetical protein
MAAPGLEVLKAIRSLKMESSSKHFEIYTGYLAGELREMKSRLMYLQGIDLCLLQGASQALNGYLSEIENVDEAIKTILASDPDHNAK